MSFMTPVTKRNLEWVQQNLRVVRVSGGIEAECLCPFHEDSRPSFYVNLDTGSWICHGCRVAGTSIGTLGKRLDIEIPHFSEEYLLRKVDLGGEWWRSSVVEDLKPAPIPLDFQRGHRYWAERGVTEDTLTSWDLGYSRLLSSLIIPIYHNGRYRGFIQRRLSRDGEPVVIKYLEPKGYRKSRYLFGYTKALKRHSKVRHDMDAVLVVEGVIDAILGWQYGIPTVATAGGPLTFHHMHYIRSINPTWLLLGFDSDVAGSKFLNASQQMLNDINHGQFIRQVHWPRPYKDLGEAPPDVAIETVFEAYKRSMTL